MEKDKKIKIYLGVAYLFIVLKSFKIVFDLISSVLVPLRMLLH